MQSAAQLHSVSTCSMHWTDKSICQFANSSNTSTYSWWTHWKHTVKLRKTLCL